MSRASEVVLAFLLEDPTTPRYGLEIINATGIRAGSLYPMLHRFEKAAWVTASWEAEKPEALGRPRRRHYQLTALGAEAATTELRNAASRLSRAGIRLPGLRGETT